MTKIPRWLILLSGVFIVKNVVLAGLGNPWYGEDEPSNFGNIEALARENRWYVFDENFASIEMRMAHRWWDLAEDKSQVVTRLMNGEFRYLRSYASPHMNATAYQPALYYWLMSRIYRCLDGWDILSLLYLMRMINIGWGLITLWAGYAWARTIFSDRKMVILMMTMIAFHPLLSLTTASVSVQPMVYGLFSIFLWLMADRPVSLKLTYGLAMVVMAVGLLTQQAFMTVPIVLAIDWLITTIKRRISIKMLMVLVLMWVGILAGIYPQWSKRNADTKYTASAGKVITRRYGIVDYLPNEGERIRHELVDNFWDQNRSMIPYQTAEKLKRLSYAISIMAGLGLVKVVVDKKYLALSVKRRRTMLVGGLVCGMFVIGHFSFDFIQIKFGGQEYIKARYFYPVIVVIISSMIWGLANLINHHAWKRRWIWLMISMMVLLNSTATSWLWIKLNIH